MRFRRVVRASDSQCHSLNCPGFDLGILRHSGILEAADETMLNTIHKKNSPKNNIAGDVTKLFVKKESKIQPR
jgi:hypothetical protein